MKARYWLILGLAGHLFFQAVPAWKEVEGNRSGRDFASYYYALQVATAGGDPYDTEALEKLAKEERTRKMVHPFFYPPPFLLAMGWAKPLSLVTAYRLMLLFNELLLAGCLWTMYRGFSIGLPWIALLLCFWSPIPDNAWMGQANLLALLPTLAGLALARQRPVAGGILVGIAGMLKMSPALFLLHFALRRNWRAVFAGMGTAVALSVLALPLVGWDIQLHFYRDVLPGFSTGDYNGLSVPITLPANHSLPDLLNRAFPSGGDQLSGTARLLSQVALIVGLAGWAFWFRPRAAEPPEREALAIGALSLLSVMLPVYTYEHHLVFLLLAVAAVGQAATGKIRWIYAGTFFFLAWPLAWLRGAQNMLPFLSVPIRESKFIAELLLLGLCMYLWRATQKSGQVNSIS